MKRFLLILGLCGAVLTLIIEPYNSGQPIQELALTPDIDESIRGRPFEIGVASAMGVTEALAGSNLMLTFTIDNMGNQPDIYAVTVTSPVSWANMSGVPSSLSLASGASKQIILFVTVPPTTPVGTKGKFVIVATSQANPREIGEGSTEITVTAPSGKPLQNRLSQANQK